MVFLVGQVPLLPNTSVSQFGWLVSLGEMATLALVQLYRYQRVSSPRERQQTKWVVFGLAVPITVAVSVSVPYLIFPAFTEPGSLYPLAYNQVSIMHPFFGVTLESFTFFGVSVEYFRVFKQLFGRFVLISFRSSGGILNIALRFTPEKVTEFSV